MSSFIPVNWFADRRITLHWWWLIWAAAGTCVFLCGALLGLVSLGSGAPGESRWFGGILSPPFGGRDRVTLLVVGVDDSEGRGLGDTLMVGVVDARSGEIGILSIPRDSRVFVPGVSVRRINEAHSFGGLPLTIQTVELLLGLPIDYYIEVNVPGIVQLVDAFGGMEIDVEKRMLYQDRAQNLYIDLHPGLQLLNGQQAMGYIRFRHDAMGDLGRIERQRRFVRAVASRLLDPDQVTRVPQLAQTFVETVNTNLGVRDLLALKKMVAEAGPEAIRMATLPGVPRSIRGQSMIELSADEVQSAVDRILMGQGISVRVLNGTGINGLAARAASLLEQHGCAITEVGNAGDMTETTLIIDHRGRAVRAQRVAGWLGCGAISVDPGGGVSADVTVVLGRDAVEVGR